jgi:hypothetical protein
MLKKKDFYNDIKVKMTFFYKFRVLLYIPKIVMTTIKAISKTKAIRKSYKQKKSLELESASNLSSTKDFLNSNLEEDAY